MLAGLLLIVGAVLLVFGFYRIVQKTNDSPTLRFMLPGRQFESGDFWSIAKWVALPALFGILLLMGGLPGINVGDGSSAASSNAPASPAAADRPKPAVCTPGNTVRYRGCESWADLSGESCRGDGCKAGAFLAAQRRLEGE